MFIMNIIIKRISDAIMLFQTIHVLSILRIVLVS